MHLTSVHNLRVHPAQMRTRVDVMGLAKLAVQVRRGIDPNLALLLRPDGQGAFIVISGHRRWLALMIAHIANANAEALPIDAEQDLSLMQATIERLCPIQDGFVVLDEELYQTLQGLVPETLTVPYQLWDGPAGGDEILLLITANTGAEEADLVGQARAFKAAIDQGVSYDTLSQVTGQPESRLQAMGDLLAIPHRIFRDLINDGLLDLSIVLDLVALNSKQGRALGQAMEAKYKADRKRAEEENFNLHDYKDYTSRVRLAALQMSAEPTVPRRRDVEPATYNLAVAVDALWKQTAESSPDQLYQAIARQSIEGSRLSGVGAMIELLSGVPTVQERFDVDVDRYHRRTAQLTDEAIGELLPEMDCSTCAFINLPAERVTHELPFACRERPSSVAHGPCLSWTPEGKRFSVRTPYYWTRGGEQVTSLEELQAAWQAQWDREQVARSSGTLSGTEGIAEQRAYIRFYMERHTEAPFTVDHPWATPCSRCAHHLEGSPVKSDPDAPRCAWAKGKRRLQFQAYVPEDGTIVAELGKVIPEGQGLVPFDQWKDWKPSEIPFMIPSCLQFAPGDEWVAIVPEANTEPPYPRDVLVTLIEDVAGSVNRNVYSTDSRGAVQFLTGRPLSASASHRKTFRERLKEEEPSLTDRQLWTLLQWLWLEWLRVQNRASGQKVPMGGGQVMHTNLIYFSTALELKGEEDKE